MRKGFGRENRYAGKKGKGKQKSSSTRFKGKTRTSYFAVRDDGEDDDMVSFMAIRGDQGEKRDRPLEEGQMEFDTSGRERGAAVSASAAAAAFFFAAVAATCAVDGRSGDDAASCQWPLRAAVRSQRLRLRRFRQLHRARRAHDEAVPLCAERRQFVEHWCRCCDTQCGDEFADHREHRAVDAERRGQRDREQQKSLHGR